jgi:hypothetical protein
MQGELQSMWSGSYMNSSAALRDATYAKQNTTPFFEK